MEVSLKGPQGATGCPELEVKSRDIRPRMGSYSVSKCDSCPGLLCCSTLSGTTTVTLPWGRADTHSGSGDGCHPGELWQGKELEPQRACEVCILGQHRQCLDQVPFAQQAWLFLLV